MKGIQIAKEEGRIVRIKAIILAACSLFITVPSAMAAPVSPTANFTLRSTTNAGPATGIDSTWGGGFDGFLTNIEGSQVDRTYFEFDMAAFGAAVGSATFDFSSFTGQATDIVSMGWYAGNGVAELADWSVAVTPFTTFDAGQGTYSIDVAALINSSIGSLTHIGFAFTIDAHPAQAFFDMSATPMINFTPAAVPEPGTLALLGLGLVGVGFARRKKA